MKKAMSPGYAGSPMNCAGNTISQSSTLRNRNGWPAPMPNGCRARGKAHLENCHPAGCRRRHCCLSHVEAVPAGAGAAGVHLSLWQKVPHAEASGKRAHRPVQDLGQNYTPEAIQRRILYPRRSVPAGKRTPPDHGLLLLLGETQPRKLTGLRALYYSYLYKVGVLRKKPLYPSYAVREDIRKLDQRIEQAEFIFQHHVEDRGQLASLRQQAEDEIAVLLKQRQKLYRYEPDSPQISALTEKLRQLRHTAKLCGTLKPTLWRWSGACWRSKRKIVSVRNGKKTART